jgi:acyl-CoA thioester hydrolase
VTATFRIEPRWTDLDPLGHVNNSVYLVYAEEARARYLRGALPEVWDMIVVVNNSIDYHSPVEATDMLEVTSTVESVGTSSFTTVSHIATADGRRCATVRTVQVVLREDREGTRPWTDSERESLDELIAAGAGATADIARTRH